VPLLLFLGASPRSRRYPARVRDLREQAPNQALPYGAALALGGVLTVLGLGGVGLGLLLLIRPAAVPTAEPGLDWFSLGGGIVLMAMGLVLPKVHRYRGQQLRATGGRNLSAERNMKRPWRWLFVAATVWGAAAALLFYEARKGAGLAFLVAAVGAAALAASLRASQTR
jgi:hypothetical protein